MVGDVVHMLLQTVAATVDLLVVVQTQFQAVAATVDFVVRVDTSQFLAATSKQYYLVYLWRRKDH